MLRRRCKPSIHSIVWKLGSKQWECMNHSSKSLQHPKPTLQSSWGYICQDQMNSCSLGLGKARKKQILTVGHLAYSLLSMQTWFCTCSEVNTWAIDCGYFGQVSGEEGHGSAHEVKFSWLVPQHLPSAFTPLWSGSLLRGPVFHSLPASLSD